MNDEQTEQVKAQEIDGEPEIPVQHVEWAEGATLVFLCQSCGHAQPAGPSAHEGGISADQARADGWVIADGLVLCPESACGIRRRDSSATRPQVDQVPPQPPAEMCWDGQQWVCYARDRE